MPEPPAFAARLASHRAFINAASLARASGEMLRFFFFGFETFAGLAAFVPDFDPRSGFAGALAIFRFNFESFFMCFSMRDSSFRIFLAVLFIGEMN